MTEKAYTASLSKPMKGMILEIHGPTHTFPCHTIKKFPTHFFSLNDLTFKGEES